MFAGRASHVRLANPIAATMSVMRSSLVGGLVATLAANLNRGETQVRLVEIGRCFEGEKPDLAVHPERIAGLAYGDRIPEQWAEKTPAADFFDIKGDLEALAAPLVLEFEATTHPSLHPGRSARVKLAGRPIGVVGELHPRLQQQFELPSAPVLFEVLTGPLLEGADRKSTRLNSSHIQKSRMPSSA